MLHALIFTAACAVASFAAAAALVFVLVRAIERLDLEPRPDAPHVRDARRRRRFRREREPTWWPEFERAFADYVRTGAARES